MEKYQEDFAKIVKIVNSAQAANKKDLFLPSDKPARDISRIRSSWRNFEKSLYRKYTACSNQAQKTKLLTLITQAHATSFKVSLVGNKIILVASFI